MLTTTTTGDVTAGAPTAAGKGPEAPPTPLESVHDQDTSGAAFRRAFAAEERMREVLVAAGVTWVSPWVDAERPDEKITLPSLPAEGVAVMADLMRKGMERDFAVAEGLRAAFDHIGVTISDISVIGRRLALGEVLVADADYLAVLLGAPNVYDDNAEVDFNHWPTAQEVVARLDAMVKEVTGDLLGTDFHPECRNCGTEAAVRLGELDIDAAEKLASLIAPAAER